MKSIEEVNLEKILPSNGPSINEVKKYLNKYKNEYIVIKIGGSVLLLTGVAILTNQLQVLGFFILEFFPSLENIG